MEIYKAYYNGLYIHLYCSKERKLVYGSISKVLYEIMIMLRSEISERNIKYYDQNYLNIK